MIVFSSDRELVSRIGFLEPDPDQFDDFGCVLPLVIAPFPAVFVVHIFGIFPCRGSRIIAFISGRGHGNVCLVFPDFKEPFKLGVHLLHDCSVAALVGMVLHGQMAVLSFQVRQ